MNHFFKYTFLLFTLLIITSSCSKFRKIQKSTDWKVKYDAATDYYNNKDYYRSNLLLEEIIPVIRGTEEAEYANFIYAYTYYHQDQFILASHYFKLFTEVYGRSEYVEESKYMWAKSLYMQSPQPSLDQTSTLEAISALQQFLNTYPDSEYGKSADEAIHELQVKLETKAYENAKLYHKLRRYKSTQVAVKNFALDYPDSKYNEELAYLGIESAYDLAKVSITSLQEERFKKVVEQYQKFIDKYSESKFIKQAEKYYEDSIKQLTIFADQNKKNQ